MTDVLLTGEAMGLFIAEEVGEFEEVDHFSKGIAGAEINVAIGLSRLDFEVEYMSKLGKDPFGFYIKNHLEKEKIGTEFVLMDEIYRTGLQIKGKVTVGDPGVAYYRKGSAYSTLTKEDISKIDFSSVRLFHITGIPLALTESTREMVFTLADKAKESGCKITFDPNLRPSLWESQEKMISVINEISQYADVFMPGIEEAQILTGKNDLNEIADYYLEKGISTVIIKDGEKGAYYKEKDQELKLVPGFKVDKVVDTVGAGDGFAVGIISSILDGLSIEEAIQRGNAIGSLQVQHKSDNEALPTRKELSNYIK